MKVKWSYLISEVWAEIPFPVNPLNVFEANVLKHEGLFG